MQYTVKSINETFPLTRTVDILNSEVLSKKDQGESWWAAQMGL